MAEEQVITAMELCQASSGTEFKCDGCPYLETESTEGFDDMCYERLIGDALALIRRLKNERAR